MEAMLERWLDPMVKKWVTGIETLARIAVRFPQTAYVGLVSSLQAEWQYICRVVPGADQYRWSWPCARSLSLHFCR